MSFIILDLDNCISDDSWRIPRIKWQVEDPFERYHEYHSLLAFDQSGNRDLYMGCPHQIIVFTARPALYLPQTQEWLLRNGVPTALLMMRANDDHSPSTLLKKNMLESLFKNTDVTAEDIVCAFDDRPEVLSMYLSMGITAQMRSIHDVCAYTNPLKQLENLDEDSRQGNGADAGDLQGEGQNLQGELFDDRGNPLGNVPRGDNTEDSGRPQQVASVSADDGESYPTR